ncbi:MAG: hypothetical protein AB7U43_05620 [Desulfobacter sp.]
MSAPKPARKTPLPMRQRVHPHTDKLRQNILAILQQHINQPMTDLQQRTGANKFQLNGCMEWLKAEGHNILALARGYILLADTLPTFTPSPVPGPLICTAEGGHFTVSNGSDTITAPQEEWQAALSKEGAVSEKSITEIPAAIQRQQCRKTGRPAAAIPADLEPLLESFRNAAQAGNPLYRTGKCGVFARRGELPEAFQSIGRDRLERIVAGLESSGRVTQGANGALSPA